MDQSSSYFTGTFATQQQLNENAACNDPNLQFFKQTFQEPLQYGMASYKGQAKAYVKSTSSGSTERWPSDEQFVTPPKESASTDTPTIASMLPIRDVQQLFELENRIASAQHYHCLLQVIAIHHKGSLNKMFPNFIADQVLERIGFIRNTNEKCNFDCAMKTDLKRIMMALKVSWFPNMIQEGFEVTIKELLTNTHAQSGDKVNDGGSFPAYYKSAKQSALPTQNMTTPLQDIYLIQQNQWYQYVLYYRDRYQIAKKANHRMKAELAVQEREYKKRISRCLKRIRVMDQYLKVLEDQVQQLK